MGAEGKQVVCDRETVLTRVRRGGDVEMYLSW